MAGIEFTAVEHVVARICHMRNQIRAFSTALLLLCALGYRARVRRGHSIFLFPVPPQAL